MEAISRFFVTKDITIRQAIERLDQTAKKLLVVVEDKKLIGVITDGDIRRWILKNGDIKRSVSLIMNTSPVFLNREEKDKCIELMKAHSIEAIPLINDSREVVDILFWNEVYDNQFKYYNTNDIPVMIMAGGKGTRLHPYTKIIPKPLIPIGDTPIVERIINRFLEFGFNDFYLIMNYKKDMIKAYFNGEQPYQLNFLEEDSPLGTAGSLSVFENNIQSTFFVSNCDILIDINYSQLLNYHKKHHYKMTVVTALKNYEIPYGVFTLNEKGAISTLREKPQYELLVNTGMYVLEAELLSYIPKESYFDMTDLINQCLVNSEPIGAYPIRESAWLDMGEFKAMQNMVERLKL
ncbi:nucleotidyltransferase family protein [Cellulosilyticum sp. I15G10I2]|uniref:nucleotidyltransferase family protein n=1 Tax=Cellulosilyticum sp. I15G10I2 TaxID=1892843 RepID=UPI00085CABB0|nr:nucleotidyltransferase family protein [Cellulosilyticum sp. I15G10I2]